RVHGPDDSQNVVFEEVKPLLTSLLDGYNVCIMAYGQTGSGKTHTMVGSQPQRSLQGCSRRRSRESSPRPLLSYSGMSGVSGAALWEVSCINRSLSALADVLGALAEQRPHVPYRNSKLTHLLQDVIGGDAKLLLMLCVSPTQRFLTESLHSLALGTRARQVQKDLPRQKS
ncbi:unnamed protein product, partial [Tetraodon nigroviridis]